MGGQSSKVTGGHWAAPGQTRKSGDAIATSALPRTADISACDLSPTNHPLALRCRERAVAVGTEITLRPPHRTRRALLTHRAPTLDSDEEPLLRPRMQDAWEWQVSISDRLHSGPR